MFNIRRIVSMHLGRERLDVALAVLLPLVFIVGSGLTNALVFAGGHLGLDVVSAMALLRGVSLEALIYACFKLARVFVLKGKRAYPAAVLALLLGMVAMIVSAGCNLGWTMQSPDMQYAFRMAGLYMPDWMATIFRVGLGLIAPVGVGIFALLDTAHLVDELLRATLHLDNRALHALRSDIHRTGYLRELKRAAKKAQTQYRGICEADAENMIAQVRRGDLSFDAGKIAQAGGAQSSVTRVIGPGNGPVMIPGANSYQGASSYYQQQPTINGQYGPAPAFHSGATQTIPVPPAAGMPPQQQGLAGRLANFFNGTN
jgi:hypothetical protein